MSLIRQVVGGFLKSAIHSDVNVKSMEIKELRQVIVPGLTPSFLGKPAVWFEENLPQLKKAATTQSFYADNILFLEKGDTIKLTHLLRQLTDIGYEKVERVEDMGEFAHRGNLVELFPLTTTHPLRLEFVGNTLESIEPLTKIIHEEDTARELLIKRLKSQKLYSDLKDLAEGEFVVHLDHGIGRFGGIEEMTISGDAATYYKLEYAKGDTLFVPTDLERKLSRYVGFVMPTVSRLGSGSWEKQKRKTREEAEKLAVELLELYATRETATRPQYLPYSDLEKHIIDTFPYTETPDQTQAIKEVAADLQKSEPMDRVVVGDVGFGKTEVALRTIVKAVASGYQAAIICPTTVLAAQHYATVSERFSDTPVNVCQLSRLQTKGEQSETLERLHKGTCDIVIGTHRLLSKDVSFKKLQLVVIDEEQRFGVKQKEQLKQLRSAVDVLSLSATPIPRTLYLALSALRNMSFVHTPPEGRKSIETTIQPWSKATVAEAITKELERGGQVYYLHNRVDTIGAIQRMIEKMSHGDTHWRVGILHGKLPEKQMIEMMRRFREGEVNILVATTIIENGLDLPNANTLIVANTAKLGLAQAYQIRGRVGRSHEQAYAYLLHPEKITEEAKLRLKALKEAEALGSGYLVARRDLEIRGAGNLLGREQSGRVNAVGLNLYCQMVADAVERLKAKRHHAHH